MSKRIEYIDIAKGIGILLVVMGHNDFALVSPFFYKLIYSFHMPLFFFVSGMLFKNEIPFIEILKRRYQTILKPYIVTLLLIFIMTVSFTRVNFDVATGRLIKALYSNGHYLDWVQLWFLPHLFALNVFAYIFFQLTRFLKSKWINLGLLFFCLVIGVQSIGLFWPIKLSLIGQNLTLFGLPLSIDLILVSGFFFVLGSEVYKNVPENFFSSLTTFLGSITILILMVLFLPQTIDFNTRSFQSLPINTAEALLGIIFILALSKQIERIPKLSPFFQYIGQASLIILIFHVPIQETWGEKLLLFFNNQKIAYWLSYFAGVILPILINHFIIKPNPIVRSWFGQNGIRQNNDQTHENLTIY